MAVNFKLLRSNTADKRPTGAQLGEGELALNFDAADPGLFFEDDAGAIRKVGPTTVSTTAPNANAAGQTGNSVGEAWLDTSVTPNILKVWDGSGWIAVNEALPTLTSNQIIYGTLGGSVARDFNTVFEAQTGIEADTLAKTVTVDGDVLISDERSLKLFEDQNNGGSFIGLKAPASVTSSATLTLPDGDGNANEVLTTDGSGNLAWSSNAALPALASGEIFVGSGAGATTQEEFDNVLRDQGRIDATGATSTQITLTNGNANFAGTIQVRDEEVQDGGLIQFFELSSNGAASISLKAPDNVINSAILTLPDGAGSNGNVLSTDGTGVLSWVSATSGQKGEKGIDGTAGTKGQKGQTGSNGQKGDTGADGAKGATGEGAKGQKGQAGTNGTDGDKGEAGTNGTDGTKGQKGQTGDTGAKGATGVGQKGATGAKGIDGSNGDKGQKGQTGTGTTGDKGATGAKGIDGAKGEPGTNGTDGDKGQKGLDGNGEKGQKGASGAASAKGQKGIDGSKGEPGTNGTDGDKGQKGEIGAKGSDGQFGGATFDYSFDTDTGATDPGSGDLKLNNATVSSATQLYISDIDTDGTDISNFLQSVDNVVGDTKGYFRIANRLDASDFAVFEITDLTDNTGWWTVLATFTTGPGAFTNGEDIIISFQTHGDTGAKGQKGADGVKGQKGLGGTNGTNGNDGAKGEPGENGTNGTDGDKGQKGVDGDKGQKGLGGTNGTDGDKGETGAKGINGQKGASGTNGNDGSKGQKGATGAKGNAGSNGTDGDKGQKGVNGTKGDNGQKGSDGEKGQTGAKGATGDKGINGSKGDTGTKGEDGEKGQKGATGAQGTKGDTGSDGTKGEPGEKGQKGLGDKGQKGDGSTAAGNTTQVQYNNAGTLSGTSLLRITGGEVVVETNLIPGSDNTRNLGSASFRFANIYTGDLHLANDRGDWTIIEESDCLTMRNNKTGKVYNINMTERTE